MRQRKLKNEINVVPYIDVMLVLLVIFMVATPMMTTATIDVPTVGNANQMDKKPLEVSIKADESLLLTDRANGDKEVRIDRKELIKLVKAAQARDSEQPVVISGDKKLKYETVIAVVDELKNDGVKKVGLVVQTTGK